VVYVLFNKKITQELRSFALKYGDIDNMYIDDKEKRKERYLLQLNFEKQAQT
jgi:hypothetical protein